MVSMTSTWRAAVETLVSDLRHVFAGRLRSVVAYGPHIEGVDEAPLTCLALVESLSVSDLEACAGVEPEWERRRLATPLVLPEDEFRRSLDAFPLEYGEIVRAHERVYGADPFAGVEIPREDLRRACETQVKSHLVHLREGFIEAGNKPQRIAELVTASAPAFAALLRHVAQLTGARATSRSEVTLEGARAAGIPEGVVRDVLALEHPSTLPTADAARLFPPYLAAVEQLARTIDTWRT
jgi:hypothetical protein